MNPADIQDRLDQIDAPIPLGGGASQAGARAYNERLVLALIRKNGALPKADLARLSGLSAQTLTLMMRRLEADGLVVAQDPLRGRIGQPSVPYALNPRGAFAFGVKIGRRSTEVVLTDFLGAIVGRAKRTYAYPLPDTILDFVVRQVASLKHKYAPRGRVTGIGIAMPFELWKWADEVDAPAGALDGWRTRNIGAALSKATGLQTFVANDATAACGAELAAMGGSDIDLLYVFVGSFVGGGLVLNGSVYEGRTGNAGALGSMPVVVGGKQRQLIQAASLISLEKALPSRDVDTSLLQRPETDWSSIGRPLTRWIEQAGQAIAQAAVAGAAVVDVQRVVVDGALTRDVLAALVAVVRKSVAAADLQGLTPFDIVEGRLGSDARVLGGAMLPINAGYGCDTGVMLKALAVQVHVEHRNSKT
jgi:predicted NBD/HSP70 family sugar kinase